MRKIGLFWYGIFIGSGSLQAKENQENVEKKRQVDEKPTERKKVAKILILSPTTKVGHHH